MKELTLEEFKEITSIHGTYKGQKGVAKDCRNNNFKFIPGKNGSIEIYYLGLFDDNLKDKDITKDMLLGQARIVDHGGWIVTTVTREGFKPFKGARYNVPVLNSNINEVSFPIYHLKDGVTVDPGHWNKDLINSIFKQGEVNDDA